MTAVPLVTDVMLSCPHPACYCNVTVRITVTSEVRPEGNYTETNFEWLAGHVDPATVPLEQLKES